MKMQSGVKWTVLGIALMLTIGAHIAAAATYSLECNANKQGKITAQLNTYRFEISAPTNPQTGQRAGQTRYELIVHMPVQRAYAGFVQAMDTNELMHTCKLTETESGGVVRPGSGAARPVDTLEWTFQDVILSNATAMGSDGSGPSGGGLPQGGLQVTLTFRSFILMARP